MLALRSFGGVGRALSHRGFFYYFIGNVPSMIGTWASRAAIAWLTWDLTHQATWLGLVAFAELLPMALAAPAAGPAVDRYGTLRCTKLAQAAMLVIMVSIATVVATGLLTRELLLVFAVVQGLVTAINNPSHLSLVGKLVPHEDLAPAVALQSGLVQTCRFIGPAVAGVMLSTVGAAPVFVMNAVTYILFLAALSQIEGAGPSPPRGVRRSLAADFAEGVRYAKDHALIRTVLIFTACMALLIRPVTELLAAFADEMFGRGADGLAVLLSSLGAGATVSAVLLATIGHRYDQRLLYRITLLLGALSLVGFAFSGTLYIGAALIAVFGFMTNIVSITGQTIIQVAVEDHMRARVMSLLGLTFRMVPACGALALGGAADLFGLSWPVVVSSLLCVAAWFQLTRVWSARAAG